MLRRLACLVALTLLGGGAVFAAGPASAAAAPPNDDRVNAIVVPSMPATISVNNSDATRESGDRWYTTIWYSYTPAVNSRVAVRASSSPGVDNTLEVWSGGSLVVSNDDFYGLDAMLSFAATAGTTYLIGEGSWQPFVSGAATLTMNDRVPDVPDALDATSPSSGHATVTWSAPADNGMGITGYTIRWYAHGALVSSHVVVGTPPTRSWAQSGLTDGTAYTFTVAATNLIGTSSESPVSNPVTPAGPPGAPMNVTATGGPASGSVHWQSPDSDGGSPVTGYTVTLDPGGAICTTDGDHRSCVINGLTNGTTYTATVTATNLVDTSAPSDPSNAVAPVDLPGAPTSVVATGGKASATVNWQPPVSDGGSPVTGYTVALAPGGATCTTDGAGRSCVVSDLANGTTYTATVTAANALGKGPDSAGTTAVTDPKTTVTDPTPTVTVTVTVPRPAHTVVTPGGAVDATCAVSAGEVSTCEVTVYATVHGRPVVVGHGTGTTVVHVTLNARGRALVAHLGGRDLRAQTSITVVGVDGELTATASLHAVATTVQLSHAVRFAGSSVVVRPAGRNWLRSLRHQLTGVRSVTCIGYTSTRGTKTYRRVLATTRAGAMCQQLTHGLDIKATVANGGAHHPVASNATKAGRAANRRVVVVLGY